MKLIASTQHAAPVTGQFGIEVGNEVDPRELSLEGIHRVDLHFPKFNDGRAFSQAVLLRRRLGFKGEIRATGDVLIDQLVHMHRSGFTSAVLAEGVRADAAQRQIERFTAFYQGDVLQQRPLFARQAAELELA